MTHLYGTDEYPEAKTIDVVLCRLRKRLAPYGLAEAIESVWGYGYKLNGSIAEPALTHKNTANVRQERLAPV